MAGVEFDRVAKVYPDGTRAVSDMNLDIEDGEFVVLVGPSGCGKTTALRMVAGLEEISEGVLRIGDRVVNHVPSRDRDIAMVFQSYALYPHLSVYDNIAFGLKLRKEKKAEIDTRVQEAARILGLEPYLKRKPRALSGGQRQRVAMGRAIVREPAAFLMDEPLSNLDAKLRVTMRSELSRLHDRLGVTTVYVTHDQVEAMTLGQRVVVLRDGVIQQVDTPQALYARPENLFVAAFIGSPAMNLVEATVADGRAAFAGWDLPLDPARRPRDGRVILGLRPESFEDASLADGDLPTVEVDVTVVEELGSDSHVIFPIEAPRVEAEELRAAVDDEEDALIADDRSMWNARVSSKAQAEPGRRIRLALDPAELYFFDPETGASLTVGAPAAAAVG